VKLNIYGDAKVGFKAHGESDPAVSELKPCPFCGSNNILVSNSHTPCYAGECQDCGATGPSSGAPRRYAVKSRAAVEQQHAQYFMLGCAAWDRRAS
jgi:hypothetical protein